MADSMTELLQCPFCGASDAFAERDDLASAYVTCNHCSARGPVECQENDDEETPGKSAAEISWNTRINRAALLATPAVSGETGRPDIIDVLKSVHSAL
jgi:Lar family restriction alleviation protein